MGGNEVGGSGVAAGVAGGVAVGCIDACASSAAGESEAERSDASVACTMASAELIGEEDAEAQPASANIELADTKNRRSCRIIVVIPF